MKFFKQLNFSSSNEDGLTELSALTSHPCRRMLCLTGSGSRALDMLLGDPGELISVDINPFQNELLQLKIAAYKVLDDSELSAYLGISDSHIRHLLHERVERALPPASKAFWARRMSLVQSGVWYAGRWEKVLRLMARGTRLARGKNIDHLFAAHTLAEQADLWTRHFDDKLWRTAIRLLGRPWVWTRVIGEPGGAFLPSPKEVEDRLTQAFAHASRHFYFRESDFISLILKGFHEFPLGVPLHMQQGNTDVVRGRLDRVRIVNGGLTDLEKLGISSVDAFSLSDFSSYCTPQQYEACWNGIAAAASPKALVCERVFLNTLPQSSLVVWDDDLSRKLTERDKSLIYKIRVGAFH